MSGLSMTLQPIITLGLPPRKLTHLYGKSLVPRLHGIGSCFVSLLYVPGTISCLAQDHHDICRRWDVRKKGRRRGKREGGKKGGREDGNSTLGVWLIFLHLDFVSSCLFLYSQPSLTHLPGIKKTHPTRHFQKINIFISTFLKVFQ